MKINQLFLSKAQIINLVSFILFFLISIPVFNFLRVEVSWSIVSMTTPPFASSSHVHAGIFKILVLFVFALILVRKDYEFCVKPLRYLLIASGFTYGIFSFFYTTHPHFSSHFSDLYIIRIVGLISAVLSLFRPSFSIVAISSYGMISRLFEIYINDVALLKSTADYYAPWEASLYLSSSFFLLIIFDKIKKNNLCFQRNVVDTTIIILLLSYFFSGTGKLFIDNGQLTDLWIKEFDPYLEFVTAYHSEQFTRTFISAELGKFLFGHGQNYFLGLVVVALEILVVFFFIFSPNVYRISAVSLITMHLVIFFNMSILFYKWIIFLFATLFDDSRSRYKYRIVNFICVLSFTYYLPTVSTLIHSHFYVVYSHLAWRQPYYMWGVKLINGDNETVAITNLYHSSFGTSNYPRAFQLSIEKEGGCDNTIVKGPVMNNKIKDFLLKIPESNNGVSNLLYPHHLYPDLNTLNNSGPVKSIEFNLYHLYYDDRNDVQYCVPFSERILLK